MKRLLAALLLALLVGIGALAATFRPATLPVGAASEITLPSANPPAGMKVAAMTTGRILSRGAFAYRGGSFAEERSFGMNVLLVEHPRGNLLFDAGFGRDVDAHVRGSAWLMRATTNYEKGEPAADQLRAAGFDPSRLAGVVLTHAHWDHVSGLADLAGVPVWVSAAERGFIAGKHPGAALLRGFGELPYRVYEFPNGPYLGFERSWDVFDDGSVVLVPAPGHTPGSVIAFLALPTGDRYALVGDLVWQKEGLEIPAERPWLSRRLVDVDPAGVRRAIVRMHQIRAAAPELTILPAHDSRAWEKVPRLAVR